MNLVAAGELKKLDILTLQGDSVVLVLVDQLAQGSSRLPGGEASESQSEGQAGGREPGAQPPGTARLDRQRVEAGRLFGHLLEQPRNLLELVVEPSAVQTLTEMLAHLRLQEGPQTALQVGGELFG